MNRRNIPLSSRDIMLNSLSQNSYKQYDGCYKKWFIYCNENKLNVFEASIPHVIGFFTNLYNCGTQYGTLNTYRSALALIIREKLSENEDIKRFFKGVFRSRPPRPKYNETWDTSLVLNYLESYCTNDNTNLEKTSKKLVTLLALVTAQRMQTLSKIKISNIIISESIIKIKIIDLIKTSRVGAPQPLLTLPFCREKPEICPAKTILAYLEMTKSLRGDADFLFISFRRPHKPVGVQTLSRWVKDILGKSGIDTFTFTAHSTRHASTSTAHRLGVNIDQIMNTAGWSSGSNTFARFYNRPIIHTTPNDNFSRTIVMN